jgi:hypothetical protein
MNHIHIHTRLAGNGALKDFIKEGDPYLTEHNVPWLVEEKCEAIKRGKYFLNTLLLPKLLSEVLATPGVFSWYFYSGSDSASKPGGKYCTCPACLPLTL